MRHSERSGAISPRVDTVALAAAAPGALSFLLVPAPAALVCGIIGAVRYTRRRGIRSAKDLPLSLVGIALALVLAPVGYRLFFG